MSPTCRASTDSRSLVLGRFAPSTSRQVAPLSVDFIIMNRLLVSAGSMMKYRSPLRRLPGPDPARRLHKGSADMAPRDGQPEHRVPRIRQASAGLDHPELEGVVLLVGDRAVGEAPHHQRPLELAVGTRALPRRRAVGGIDARTAWNGAAEPFRRSMVSAPFL